MAIILKVGNTFPSVAAVLELEGVAIDLSGATVDFVMGTKALGVDVLRAEAVVEDAATGKVRYDWEPEDTSVAGEFLCEFEITFVDGKVATVPNNDFIEVTINPSFQPAEVV